MSEIEDLAFCCNSDIPPAIPDGDDYEVVFRRAEKGQQFGQRKLYLWFQMVTPGEWVGQSFYMACNVPRNEKWGPSSKFWLMWVFAAGRRPKRADRMSTLVFKDKVFRAKMRKVLKTSKGISRTPAQQYSVVDELLEVRAGQCWRTKHPSFTLTATLLTQDLDLYLYHPILGLTPCQMRRCTIAMATIPRRKDQAAPTDAPSRRDRSGSKDG